MEGSVLIEMKISDIKIRDGRREVDMGKVKQLADSISEIGLINPITVSEDGYLIAGSHRLAAFNLLGRDTIPVLTTELTGITAELAEIDENLIRNELHYIIRGEYLNRRKDIYEELHPETKAHVAGAHASNAEQGREHASETVSFASDTAVKVGVSPRTIEQEIQLATKLAPEVKNRVVKSDITKRDAIKLARVEPERQPEIVSHLEKGLTFDAARRELKIADAKERIAQITPSNDNIDIFATQNKYSIVYADPPWGGYFNAGNKNQENHYPLMTIEEICELPVSRIVDENAILFLWVTFPILDRAFEVIKAWGFNYSTCAFCWVKQNKSGDGYFFGNGNWTHANAELCLLATKGSVTRLDAAISQLIVSPIEEHSKKPDATRGLITRLVGEMKRIELFSRNKADGWDAWGLEAGQNG